MDPTSLALAIIPVSVSLYKLGKKIHEASKTLRFARRELHDFWRELNSFSSIVHFARETLEELRNAQMTETSKRGVREVQRRAKKLDRKVSKFLDQLYGAIKVDKTRENILQTIVCKLRGPLVLREWKKVQPQLGIFKWSLSSQKVSLQLIISLTILRHVDEILTKTSLSPRKRKDLQRKHAFYTRQAQLQAHEIRTLKLELDTLKTEARAAKVDVPRDVLREADNTLEVMEQIKEETCDEIDINDKAEEDEVLYPSNLMFSAEDEELERDWNLERTPLMPTDEPASPASESSLWNESHRSLSTQVDHATLYDHTESVVNRRGEDTDDDSGASAAPVVGPTRPQPTGGPGESSLAIQLISQATEDQAYKHEIEKLSSGTGPSLDAKPRFSSRAQKCSRCVERFHPPGFDSDGITIRPRSLCLRCVRCFNRSSSDSCNANDVESEKVLLSRTNAEHLSNLEADEEQMSSKDSVPINEPSPIRSLSQYGSGDAIDPASYRIIDGISQHLSKNTAPDKARCYIQRHMNPVDPAKSHIIKELEQPQSALLPLISVSDTANESHEAVNKKPYKTDYLPPTLSFSSSEDKSQCLRAPSQLEVRANGVEEYPSSHGSVIAKSIDPNGKWVFEAFRKSPFSPPLSAAQEQREERWHSPSSSITSRRESAKRSSSNDTRKAEERLRHRVASSSVHRRKQRHGDEPEPDERHGRASSSRPSSRRRRS